MPSRFSALESDLARLAAAQRNGTTKRRRVPQPPARPAVPAPSRGVVPPPPPAAPPAHTPPAPTTPALSWRESPYATARPTRRSPRAPRVRAFNRAVDYTVPGLIAVLKQDKSMACWAFATLMMEQWRRGQSLSLPSYLDDLGARVGAPTLYRDAYENNTGLFSDQVQRLKGALSLSAEPAASFTVARWEELLRDHGPLLVVGDEALAPGAWAVHARVMVGITGDGSPTGTTVDIVDPGTGTRYREWLGTFLAKYEELAPTDWAGVQVLHFPAGTVAGALSVNRGRRRPSRLARGFSVLPAPPPPALNPWVPLMRLTPSSSLVSRLTKFTPDGSVHRIHDAYGAVNLDWYPVQVSLPPSMSATQLLDRWRRDFNSTIDQRMAFFEPYDEEEAGLWSSGSPAGAVIHIDMRSGAEWANPDDGSVLTSEATGDHWTFSTIWTPLDMGHPVSGNRWFGYVANEDGTFTFGTRGADRTTGAMDYGLSDIVFTAAHSLWLTLLQGLANYVIALGGTATIGQATSARYDWDQVVSTYGV
ncbi:papain-like cysteine protease family protein [Nocardioides gansuensis]|uniref:papain-like cysteine protease family protein n=1 Tax=Nocardioides gansuensis TaxID=2138300 RepID=UPI00105766E8|nr:papain-like cysteine protease family protein [Nocardioides gansuensis]